MFLRSRPFVFGAVFAASLDNLDDPGFGDKLEDIDENDVDDLIDSIDEDSDCASVVFN